jgi:4-amino-4-deoxy-L-arabinose transferase-like glycosyltransferase
MNRDKTISLSEKHFFVAILILALLMKASLFVQKLVDWDEVVYLYLSEHMGWLLSHYTLQGSFISQTLTHNVYHAEVFSHPPLVPYLIKILSLAFTPLLAAKVINLGFVFLSFFLVYRIAMHLSNLTGALLAIFLWAICPIFNLESNLVHLDFPLAVFMLLGVWLFLHFRSHPDKKYFLYLSASAFVGAMLTKYTGPIYVLVPLGLCATCQRVREDKQTLMIFLSILLAGFAWWLYVLFIYGSLIPHDFIGYKDGKIFSTPYLKSISNRTWYDLWIYFAAICPLFFVYLAAAGGYIMKRLKAPGSFFVDSADTRILVIMNGAVIACVAVFSVINAFSNGYWVMRHILPIYPIIYITIGCIVSRLFARKDKILNAYLLVLIVINMFFMSTSTILTMLNPAGLKPLPALYFWIPGLSTSYF